MAARGRAGVHRSAAIGHRRAGPPGGPALPGPRTLRAARVRPTSQMRRRGLPLGWALLAVVLAAAGAAAEEQPVARRVLPNGETLLVLIVEVALEPALQEEDIERERRLLLGQIKARADAPFSLTFDALIRNLYGAHPYGRHYLGLKESIERLTRDDLRAHYRAIYRPDRMVLAVSGQVDRGRVVKVAERLFGRLARSAPDTRDALAVPAPAGERRVIERPAQQA